MGTPDAGVAALSAKGKLLRCLDDEVGAKLPAKSLAQCAPYVDHFVKGDKSIAVRELIDGEQSCKLLSDGERERLAKIISQVHAGGTSPKAKRPALEPKECRERAEKRCRKAIDDACATGTSGNKGPNPPGSPGTSGANGSSGTSGQSGASGATGPSGTSGSSGSSSIKDIATGAGGLAGAQYLIRFIKKMAEAGEEAKKAGENIGMFTKGLRAFNKEAKAFIEAVGESLEVVRDLFGTVGGGLVKTVKYIFSGKWTKEPRKKKGEEAKAEDAKASDAKGSGEKAGETTAEKSQTEETKADEEAGKTGSKASETKGAEEKEGASEAEGTPESIDQEGTSPVLKPLDERAYALYGKPERSVILAQLETIMADGRFQTAGGVFRQFGKKTRFYIAELAINRFLSLPEDQQEAYRKLDEAPSEGILPTSFLEFFVFKYLKQTEREKLRAAATAWTWRLAEEVTRDMDREAIEKQLGAVPRFKNDRAALPYLARMFEDEWLWIVDIRKRGRLVDVERPPVAGELPALFVDPFAETVNLEEVRIAAPIYARLAAKEPEKIARERLSVIQARIQEIRDRIVPGGTAKKPGGPKGGSGGSGTPAGGAGDGGASPMGGRNGKAHAAAGLTGAPPVEAFAQRTDNAWMMGGAHLTGMPQEDAAVAQQDEAWAASSALATQAVAAHALALGARAGVRVA